MPQCYENYIYFNLIDIGRYVILRAQANRQYSGFANSQIIN